MATATKTYTFTAGTTASSAEVNKNFDDVLGFLNGGAVQHSDGSKAYTAYPLLPVAAPTNARHPATKDYVDTRESNRLIASAGMPNGAITVGASQAAAYYFSPNLAMPVTANDITAQTKFIIEGEIGPCQYTSGGSFTSVVEVLLDGVVYLSSQIQTDSAYASSLRFSARWVAGGSPGTRTVRLRLWHNSGVPRGMLIANGFGGSDGWWGITRTTP
jgi:hypothetical protein